MQRRQNLFDLPHMLGADTFCIVAFEKLPQSLVLETLDHCSPNGISSVKLYFTYVKQYFTYVLKRELQNYGNNALNSIRGVGDSARWRLSGRSGFDARYKVRLHYRFASARVSP